MRLSADQLNVVVDSLKKWPVAECSLCHHDEWKLQETVFALSEYRPAYGSGAAAVLSTQVFLLIPVVCATCGNVMFLSTKAVNIL